MYSNQEYLSFTECLGTRVRVLSAWLGMDITLRYGATDQRTAEQEFDNPTV